MIKKILRQKLMVRRSVLELFWQLTLVPTKTSEPWAAQASEPWAAQAYDGDEVLGAWPSRSFILQGGVEGVRIFPAESIKALKYARSKQLLASAPLRNCSLADSPV